MKTWLELYNILVSLGLSNNFKSLLACQQYMQENNLFENETYLLMLWCPFSLLQSNKRTVPSVLALAKSDELELSAVSFVTDDLCSCKCAISVPFMLWPVGISEARFIAAFESLLAFNITYWLFSLLCNRWSSFRQSEFRSNLKRSDRVCSSFQKLSYWVIGKYLEWNSFRACCIRPMTWTVYHCSVYLNWHRQSGNHSTVMPICRNVYTFVANPNWYCPCLTYDWQSIVFWFHSPRPILCQYPIWNRWKFFRSLNICRWTSFSDICSISIWMISSIKSAFQPYHSDHHMIFAGRTKNRKSIYGNVWQRNLTWKIKLTLRTGDVISQCCGSESVVLSRAFFRSSRSVKNDSSSVNRTTLS